VALAASEGKSQAALVRDLGLTQGSISYHLKRLDLGAIKYVGRGPIVSTLGYSGVQVSELRLHDPERARFLVTDAKTETGIREVEMSPKLVRSSSPPSTDYAAMAAQRRPRTMSFRTTRAGG
jgi:hypothetical protein